MTAQALLQGDKGPCRSACAISFRLTFSNMCWRAAWRRSPTSHELTASLCACAQGCDEHSARCHPLHALGRLGHQAKGGQRERGSTFFAQRVREAHSSCRLCCRTCTCSAARRPCRPTRRQCQGGEAEATCSCCLFHSAPLLCSCHLPLRAHSSHSRTAALALKASADECSTHLMTPRLRSPSAPFPPARSPAPRCSP